MAYHLGSAELRGLLDHCQSGPDLEQPDIVKENGMAHKNIAEQPGPWDASYLPIIWKASPKSM